MLAIETGNELGGPGLAAYPPPVEWTAAIAQLVKNLSRSSNTSNGEVLVMSGSYGVRESELALAQVDL